MTEARKLTWILLVLPVVAGAAAFVGWKLLPGRSESAAAASSAEQVGRTPTPIEAAEVVFDGRVAGGWEDWGWGAHQAGDGGGVAVRFEGYGGITFHHDPLPSHFGALTFRFRAPPGFGDFLEVSLGLQSDKAPSVLVQRKDIVSLADGWQEVLLPWAALDPLRSPFDQIVIKARQQVGHDWVMVDKVILSSPGAHDMATAVREVNLAIDCDQSAHPISPLIYGVAQGDWDAGETGHRIGGNTTSRLNWDLGAWNTGNDWFFENVKGTSTIWDWLDEVRTRGAKVAVTVPMIGWVAKDATSVGFPVSQLGSQRNHDPSRVEAGDGVASDGKPLRPGAPSFTSVAAPPELIRGWIEKVREKDATGANRAVAMYILDNEPNLWSTTHRDVHPDPLSYDELLDRTIRYATAIRQADPNAVIAGPAEWGWSGYFFSAKDSVGWIPHVDRNAHGGVPLLPWYLERLASYEKKTGITLLNVVDVHFYPQAPFVYGKDARTDPQTSALRLRSTRALWDPTYRDESWIKEHVDLIPMLKDWIEKNYPGRGISIGEWSFGADEDISGGLAIAEALGRFGQQGITSAFYWNKLTPHKPGYEAFRAFRNFDGAGARFLDWSVPARGAEGVSIFASRDEASAHMVAILLNLDPGVAVQAKIDVGACGNVTSSRSFVYGPSMPYIQGEPASDASPERQRIPPYSLKVIDFTLARR